MYMSLRICTSVLLLQLAIVRWGMLYRVNLPLVQPLLGMVSISITKWKKTDINPHCMHGKISTAVWGGGGIRPEKFPSLLHYRAAAKGVVFRVHATFCMAKVVLTVTEYWRNYCICKD